MKVFITWSGERAKIIAEALRKWLPSVIQNVEPWMSETDIRPGARWQNELNQQLEQTDFGIAVLTPETLEAPWIHYETGALAKKVNTSAVCPYLVDISATSGLGSNRTESRLKSLFGKFTQKNKSNQAHLSGQTLSLRGGRLT